MLKRIMSFCIALMAMASFSAIARTDCPAGKVEMIQAESTRVIYKQENQPWRTLGPLAEEGVKPKLAMLLTAQTTGRPVVVGYISDSYNCAIDDWSTTAFVVRLY